MARHVDLAPDLDRATEATVGDLCKACPCKRARDVLDREGVLGHILACRAVAAGGSTHKPAITVGKRNAQAIDLELARIGKRMLRRGAKRLVRACEPLVELLEVHCIVDRVHALGMADGCELLAHEAADALRVGVGRHKLGVRCLDALELAEIAVELGIGHLRRIERIVGIGRMVQDLVQACRMLPGRLFRPFAFRHRRASAEERHLVCHLLPPYRRCTRHRIISSSDRVAHQERTVPPKAHPHGETRSALYAGAGIVGPVSMRP